MEYRFREFQNYLLEELQKLATTIQVALYNKPHDNDTLFKLESIENSIIQVIHNQKLLEKDLEAQKFELENIKLRSIMSSPTKISAQSLSSTTILPDDFNNIIINKDQISTSLDTKYKNFEDNVGRLNANTSLHNSTVSTKYSDTTINSQIDVNILNKLNLYPIPNESPQHLILSNIIDPKPNQNEEFLSRKF